VEDVARSLRERVGATPEQIGARGEPATGLLASAMFWVDAGVLLALPTYAPHFSRLLDLQPEDVYLDVACGSGVFLRRRANHVHKVAGIDHTPVGIDIARRLLRDRIAAGTAQVVLGDAVELPWPDGTFTAVSSNCLDCFAPGKPAQTMTEIHRVLRPGGRVLIGLEGSMADPEPAIKAMHPILQPAGRMLARMNAGARYEDPARAREYEQRTGMSMFTDAEFEALLADAGFTHITMPTGTWSRYATARHD
jgi:ubiquinone/menaquinone biosynthesis C-methylase UbiE